MKNFKKILITLTFTLIAATMAFYIPVFADSAGGGAGAGDGKGKTEWFFTRSTVTGDKGAWNTFYARRPRSASGNKWSAKTISSQLKKVWDKGGVGSLGGYSSFEAMCKASDYIMYVGETKNNHKPGGSSTGIWDWGSWYPNSSRTHRDPWHAGQGPKAGDDNERDFVDKINALNTNGLLTIGCSAAYKITIPPAKVNITYTADSKTFTYNGKAHTVNTGKLTKGKLKSGHKVEALVKTSRTNEGSQEVPVQSIRITNNSGTNVSSQYTITTVKGKITINPNPASVIDPQKPEERCIDTKLTGKTSGPVSIGVAMIPGFTPAGARFTSQPIGSYTRTQLGDYSYNGSFERTKTLPEYDRWVSAFNQIKKVHNTRSQEITLTSSNQNNLSQYGGVLNVTSQYRNRSHQVETCQPQTREWIVDQVKRPDGKGGEYIYQDNSRWGDWKNKGDRKITQHIASGETNGAMSYYQILSVNCNIDEFNAARTAASNKGITTTVKQTGDGRGSALMITSKVSSINSLPFGKTGTGNSALDRTASSSFYLDGKSCNTFTCVNTKLSSGSNDAINNTATNPLYGEVSDDPENTGEPLESGGKNYLAFFRDNQDRTVRADLWYPKAYNSNGLSVTNTQKAANTYAKILSGTPEISITTVETLNRNAINKIGGTATKISGEHNKFNVKSQWASEKDKPYEIGLSWEYRGTAKNTMPTKVNGNSVTSYNKTNGSSNDYNYEFALICEFKNDKGSTNNAIMKNNPYVNGVNTSGLEFNPTIKDNALRVLFTRAVSDID